MKNPWGWLQTHISSRLGGRAARANESGGTALILGKPAGFAGAAPAGWRVLPAAGLDEAQVLLARQEIPVVLCEREAPGIDWKRAVGLLASSRCHPSVVLLAPAGRKPRWDEVAAAGGYDVLPEPLDADALERTMRSAQRHWRNRRALESASQRASMK
jgi:DNA-binding NtrC family response regulator